MANPGDSFPPGEDWIARQLKSLQDQINANASARSLQASSIGSGGLTIENGGSITVEPGGNITLSSGTFAASVVNAPTVNATTVNATGNVNAASLNVSGAVKMPTVYSTQITSAYRVVYNGNGDGSMGYNLSSERFKQDIANCKIDPASIAAIQIVTFRYIAAVAELGDKAATEIGLIAEQVHELGLTWLVDYDDEGIPEGIKFDRLSVAALSLAQDVDERLRKLEAKAP